MRHSRTTAWAMIVTPPLLLGSLLLSGCGGPAAGAPGKPPTSTASPVAPSSSPTARGETTKSADPSPTAAPKDHKKSTEPPAATKSASPSATSSPNSKKTAKPATTPVPPPKPGSVHKTVKSRKQESKKPVKLDEAAKPATDLSVVVDKIKRVEDPETGMPDELAGPALAVTLKIDNGTKSDVDLTPVVVEVADSNGAPGNRLTGDPYAPLRGQVAAGESATGVYVYAVDKKLRDPVTITVTIAADVPVVVFRGKV